MTSHNADLALKADDRPPATALPARRTYIPADITKDCGAVFQLVHDAGIACLAMAEARMAQSASRMQEHAAMVALTASKANTLAHEVEKRLATFRRRNPLAGVR